MQNTRTSGLSLGWRSFFYSLLCSVPRYGSVGKSSSYSLICSHSCAALPIMVLPSDNSSHVTFGLCPFQFVCERCRESFLSALLKTLYLHLSTLKSNEHRSYKIRFFIVYLLEKVELWMHALAHNVMPLLIGCVCHKVMSVWKGRQGSNL